MKKSILLLFFPALAILPLRAQYANDFFVQGTVASLQYEQLPNRVEFGAGFEYFFTDNISITGRFNFGQDYFHMPVAFFYCFDAFIESLIFSDKDDYYWLIFFSEGVNFHIHTDEHFTISPYIYPLCAEYINRNGLNDNSAYTYEPYENWALGGSVGLRFNSYFNERYGFGVYYERKFLYSYRASANAFGGAFYILLGGGGDS